MDILPPIIPIEERRKRSRKELLLSVLLDAPSLTDAQVSAVTGIQIPFVKAIRKSDTFIDELAKLSQLKYGNKLSQVANKILDTEFAALSRLDRDLRDDSKSSTEHQAAAKIALEHARQTRPGAAISPMTPTSGGVSLTINIADLNRAKSLAQQHSQTIELEGQNANAAKLLEAPQDSYLQTRDKEGEPV